MIEKKRATIPGTMAAQLRLSDILAAHSAKSSCTGKETIFVVGDIPELEHSYLPVRYSFFSFEADEGPLNVSVYTVGDLHFSYALDVFVTQESLPQTVFVVMIDLAAPHAAMLSLERWLKVLQARASEIIAEPANVESRPADDPSMDSPRGQIVVLCINSDSYFDDDNQGGNGDAHLEMSFEEQQQLRLFIQLRLRRLCTENACAIMFTKGSITWTSESLNDLAVGIAETEPEGGNLGDQSPQVLLRYLLHCLYPGQNIYLAATLAATVAAREPTEPFFPAGLDTPSLQDQDFNAGIVDNVRMGWDVPFEEVVEMPSSDNRSSTSDEPDDLFALSEALDDQIWLNDLKQRTVGPKTNNDKSPSSDDLRGGDAGEREREAKQAPKAASSAKAYFEKLAKG